jgi:hypothetical protein
MDYKECPRQGGENCVVVYDVQKQIIVVVYKVLDNYTDQKVKKFGRNCTSIDK